MTNEEIYTTLLYHTHSDNPTYFRYLKAEDSVHRSFVSVLPPYSTDFDYIKAIDDYIIVIFFDHIHQYCYSVFKNLNDYMACALDDGDDIFLFDIEYPSFDTCFKSAVYDLLQHSIMFIPKVTFKHIVDEYM